MSRTSSVSPAERSRRVYQSDRDLAHRYSNSRATIWRWVETRDFPKPIKLSPGCTRWKLADVEAWEAQQAAE